MGMASRLLVLSGLFFVLEGGGVEEFSEVYQYIPKNRMELDLHLLVREKELHCTSGTKAL